MKNSCSVFPTPYSLPLPCTVNRMRLFPAALLALTLPAFAQTPLIPQPREYKPANTLPLASGIRIDCQQPCDAEDAFAVADLKSTLAERHIATTDALSAPHIFIARFGTPLGRQTYAESLSPQPATPPTTLPAAFDPEGYSIVPDKDGLAINRRHRSRHLFTRCKR